MSNQKRLGMSCNVFINESKYLLTSLTISHQICFDTSARGSPLNILVESIAMCKLKIGQIEVNF